MLDKVKPWHHVAVAVSIAVVALLASTRVIGAGDDARFRGEQFDAKQVAVRPEGADGVRIREVVDIDFGSNERRGYQRIVPNDFGVPESVTASSPDANSDLDVVAAGGETRIRVGDPAITFTGRHRYVLEYVLPDARVSTGVLALDVIGTDETLATERFDVVLTGFEFAETACDTGGFGAFGGCELERDDAGRYTTTIAPLAAGDGISVGGAITALTDPDLPPVPEPPPAVPTGLSRLGLLMVPLGLVSAALVFLSYRRRGSNEIRGAGGAAEAAYGDLPVPTRSDLHDDVPTYRVPDSRLAELATIEFVPPRGVAPWQGAALLRETVDDDTVVAWFSDMIAREALVVHEDDGGLRLEPGPNRARLSLVDQRHVDRLFQSGSSLDLGRYDKDFATTWGLVQQEQAGFVRQSGWWDRNVPGVVSGAAIGFTSTLLLVIVVGLLSGGAAFLSLGFGLLASPWVAAALAVVIPMVVAMFAYRAMLPARTATGSALTLRTESFRRFLASSEGKHVEWAWNRGVLREYSAWAVALGAADAWTRAIESSNVPETAMALQGPLLLYAWGPAFTSAHVPPSSSGGSGGGFSGGFSGGVGGGGGGGSSGSW